MTNCQKFTIIHFPGRIAQLVKAPALHAGDHRFESCFAHFFNPQIFLLIVFVLSSCFLHADIITVSAEGGIPLGDWSYELNTANGLNVFYSRSILSRLSAEAGIEASSFRTVADLYHLNILRIPAGISYGFFKNNNWSASFSGNVGISFLERIYEDASETGFNEFYSLSLGLTYGFSEENQLSVYTKYLQERFVNGKSYIGIGLAFGFIIF